MARRSRRTVWDYCLGKKVATYLIRRGRQPLPFLVRGTGLEATQIRESLVVLIQHRVVCHYTLVEGGKPTTYYQVRSSALLDRLQIGIVAYYATQWFGNEASVI
ncbi:hypothetical protein BDF22DRAFT_183991 [Syncephalis plumigaleata]|nr:hypothetical protein BDF22DRAFT_183991 [Syncephalis plumigaleata]